MIWVVNPAFNLLTTVYFHLHCNSKTCNIFRTRNYCYFLIKQYEHFWCAVLTHCIIAFTVECFKNACCISVYWKAFLLPWLTSVKHQIRLQIRSLLAPCFLWELSVMGSVVNTMGRNLDVPVLGEKEGIWVTGAFWTCFSCIFQLLKVPWQRSVSFFQLWKVANFIPLWSPKCS